MRFKTLKDHVYDYIAEQIADGSLKTDQKIDENAICSQLSISRTPVREALIQLAGDGILENVPRKGYVVKGLSLSDVRELYTVIGCLDGLAVYSALPNLTEKDFRDMEFFIESMEVAITSGHFEMYNRQQNEFHEIYISKCGNNTLINKINRLRSKLLKKSYDSNVADEVRKVLEKTNDEHREMLRMMKAGEGSALAEFMSSTHWSIENARFDLME
ncbi:MAG: GntR family transcriptional regulator [Clostridia bacterium]|nr:GntR family transcriptional regulator [Clostridia bacterium]